MAKKHSAVAVDQNGKIFVLDGASNSISVYSKDMQLERTIGNNTQPGSPVLETMHLNDPQGLALDAAGNIFVANSTFHNILKFPADGGPGIRLPATSFMEGPPPLRTLLGPLFSIAVDARGFIFVAEYMRHRVHVFDEHGRSVRKIGENVIKFPFGVALDRQGNVYVADSGGKCVTVFDMNGVFKMRSENGVLKRPRAVAVDGKGNVYVADQAANAVVVFSPTLEVIATLKGTDCTLIPTGVAVNSSGDVIVMDYYMEDLYVFSWHAVHSEEALTTMLRQSIARLSYNQDIALLIAQECRKLRQLRLQRPEDTTEKRLQRHRDYLVRDYANTP